GVTTRTVLVDSVAGHVFGSGVDLRIAIVAIAAAEVRTVAIVVAIGRTTEQREAWLAERRALLDGGGDLLLVAEPHRGFEREDERCEAEAERDEGRSVHEVRNEVRTEQHEQSQRGSPQVELGALENAPNAEPPPVPARRPHANAERHDGEREREA